MGFFPAVPQVASGENRHIVSPVCSSYNTYMVHNRSKNARIKNLIQEFNFETLRL